ncbi:serine-threonine kinase-like protein [Moumouvirus goulette]|uniref:Serine-threonine kinase-like protein n=1 Tax=Moumouvirus goulette TaxID=1247379 RepID=M1PAW6_9VIRU|nr:serine-threonine kinase-like protein [Moumouvirus goulette]AGF84994.1 serine-threonine kinase-like protein [Moumouvirus goulette]
MDLFNKHKSLTLKHRAIIINWILEVVNEYDLKHNTFQLAVCILDKYLILEEKNIPLNEIQYISVVCIVIASKLVDENVFTIKDANYVSKNECGQYLLLQKEKEILEKLGYQINYKTVWQHIKNNGTKISADVFKITYYLTCIMLIHPDYISIPTRELTNKIIKFAIVTNKNHLKIPKLSKKDVIYKYLHCMWSIATINTKLSEVKNIFTDLGIYYTLKKYLLEMGPIFEGNVNNKYGNKFDTLSNINLPNCNKSNTNKIYEINNDFGIPKEVLNELVKLISIKKHPNIISIDSYYYDIDNGKLSLGYKIKCSITDRLSQLSTNKFKLNLIRQFLIGVKHLCDNKIIPINLSIDNLFLDKNNNLKIKNDFRSLDSELLSHKKIYFAGSVIWSCGYIIGHILLGHRLFESTYEDSEKESTQFTELDKKYPEISKIIRAMLSPHIIQPDINTVINFFNNVKLIKIYKQPF